MIKRISLNLFGAVVLLSVFVLAFFVGQAGAETIEVKNPLEVDNVNQLSEKIRDYFLTLVGGLAVVFFALAGILYSVGGTTMNDGMIKVAKKAFMGGVAGMVIVLLANTILSETYYIVLGKSLSFENLSAKEILIRLSNFLLAILGIIFLIMTVIGGIMYFLGGADESKVELGKKIFVSSVIGLIISLSAFIIVRQIDAIIIGKNGANDPTGNQQSSGSPPQSVAPVE